MVSPKDCLVMLRILYWSADIESVQTTTDLQANQDTVLA